VTILTPARLAAWIGVFAALLAASLWIGLLSGPSALAPGAVLDALRGGHAHDAVRDIVVGVRLPRVVLGALVGASLATAGALFQALLRNPLADPFVLGVSGGAAVGGIAALSFGAALGVGYAAVPVAAFAGAVATTVALQALAGVAGRVSSTHLLLTGVVFNAFSSAAIVFLASLTDLREGAQIFLWLIGSLSATRAELIGSVALFLGIGLACALPAARQLNLLALGEESAEQLGVDVTRLQRVLLLATSLMVGAAVSVAGLIGFVGLIIPHLLRLLLGPDHRLLLPTAALGGAAFLVLCDTAARTCLGGRELPVGAITALAGGPLFLLLLRRQHQRAFAP
jgi:iron complex transport system permease protein